MATPFRIVSTQESVDFTAGGQFLDTVEVIFEIPESGSQGTVTVQKRDFRPEVVQKAVQDAADNLAAIERLGQ